MQANYSTHDLAKLEQRQLLAALERRRLVHDHRAAERHPKPAPVHHRGPLSAAQATVATLAVVLATVLTASA